MGEAQRKLAKKNKFLLKHPWCCLCGGSVAATTIEHAPPKVFFIDKQVPSATHRVPACERCNNGSSASDQIAALATLVQATVHQNIPDEYMDKLIRGVKNNAPDALTAIAGGESNDVPLRVDGKVDLFSRFEVDPIIYSKWLNPWAAKQAYALYYLETKGKILLPTSRIMVKWCSNANSVENSFPDKLLQSLPNYGELKQGVKTSKLQYSYKWQIDDEVGCFILMLHDASAVILGIFHDPEQADNFPNWTMFATDADSGIHLI